MANFPNILKLVLKRGVGAVARLLVSASILPKRIILRMDGGICSQMHFYLVGKVLEKNGSEVMYDISWFEENGKDLDGRHARNFELKQLFPTLPFEESRTKLLTRLYITSFYKDNDYFNGTEDKTVWTGYRAPMYLAGYFHDDDKEFSRTFEEAFARMAPALDGENLALRQEIEECGNEGFESCGVHVRRGDLSSYNPAYGNPTTPAYYLKAMEIVRKGAGRPVKFFIFSDEPEWCEQHLVATRIASVNSGEASGGDKDEEIRICSINGADKGYLDLYQMSHCRHIVCSQGSMGKYAAMLRDHSLRDGLVVLPPNATSEEWEGRFARSVRVG